MQLYHSNKKFSTDYIDSWQHGRLHIAFRLPHRICLVVLNTDLYNTIFTKMECRYLWVSSTILKFYLKGKVRIFPSRIFCILRLSNRTVLELRYRFSARIRTLEAFSPNSSDVALTHCLIRQCLYQRSETLVPLVLEWITVTIPSVYSNLINYRVKLTCLTTV